ncbi:hypothetical protein bplSymb_SCF13801P001 [Bathymodiolus platifrons methanotrophic gill symbiont]|nr:hypothetical protein bplSymb_SCF13801P001 [Bathymodiolus platifrons methanotrophic gill symbiont]
MVEALNEGVVVTNNEGYILYVNFKFSEIIGRSREALIDQKITAFVDDSNKRILKQGVESCQKHQKSTLEITWNKDNDEKIITCVSSRMIEDTCPKNNIYFAIITDITESKKVQKELILSEQKYNTVVENSLILDVQVFPSHCHQTLTFTQQNNTLMMVLALSALNLCQSYVFLMASVETHPLLIHLTLSAYHQDLETLAMT